MRPKSESFAQSLIDLGNHVCVVDEWAEMLEAVGFPVAMRTGKEGIIKLCPYHTDKVEDTVRQILDGKFPDQV